MTDIRDATPGDIEAIVDFNARLAEETEGKTLDLGVLTAGVAASLADPTRLRYWLAERDGTVIGQAAVTREWSDWRNGWLWWFQSVYVAPEARGRGVFRALYAHIWESAHDLPDVIGLRLYVEENNAGAKETYRAMGMVHGGYEVFEELWRERFGAAIAE